MNAEKLDELAALAEKAPDGRWASQDVDDTSDAVLYGPDGDSLAYFKSNSGNDYDMAATAAYIAALSPDVVLSLIARIRELESAQ